LSVLDDAHLYGNAAYAIAVLPDGRMIVGGQFDHASDSMGVYPCLNMVRLNAQGRFDPTFTNGFPETLPGAITPQPDGKLLVGGSFFMGSPYLLARLLPDGQLDPAFERGAIEPEFGGSRAIGAIRLLAGGRILVGGCFASHNGVPAFGLVRLNNDRNNGWRKTPRQGTRIVVAR
jgi:uncharacterized delta-60 repeat protein